MDNFKKIEKETRLTKELENNVINLIVEEIEVA